jgi:hypothetical protein
MRVPITTADLYAAVSNIFPLGAGTSKEAPAFPFVLGRLGAGADCCLGQGGDYMRKIVALLAAAGMSAAPVVASAQDASALSPARAAAPMLSGVSFLEDDDDNGGGSTAVILGVVLVVLIGIAAISGNGNEPNNPPQSP